MKQIEKPKAGEKAKRECPNCHSKKLERWIKGDNIGSIQRFICRECGFRFSEKSYNDYLLTENSQLCAKLIQVEKDDQFTCKIAKEPKEIQDLIEQGFEFVCSSDDFKFFKKRK